MNILIISSERLYPQNTFASIFELSQAKAISKKIDNVKILSIYELNTFNLLFALIKKIIKSPNDIANRFSYFIILKHIFFTFILNKTIIKYHRIHEIDVIEGIGVTSIYNFFFRFKFGTNWTEHGKKVFKILNNINQFDLVHAHSRFLKAGLLAYEIKNIYKIPYLITEHSSYLFKEKIDQKIILSLKNVYDNASVVIAVSRTLINIINSKIYCATEVVLIPNILDNKFENLVVKQKTNQTTFKFVTVGSLLPIKNHKLLIDAFKIICNKNVKLEIIGAGPLLKLLTHYSNKIPNIIFKGSLSNTEVQQTLINSNAFVLTSKNETFGVAIIEALACGLPIISTKSGGPEYLVTEKNGLLIDNNDPHKLANAMLDLMYNYNNYNAIEINEDCIKSFGTGAFTNKIIPLYNKVLQNI